MAKRKSRIWLLVPKDLSSGEARALRDDNLGSDPALKLQVLRL